MRGIVEVGGRMDFIRATPVRQADTSCALPGGPQASGRFAPRPDAGTLSVVPEEAELPEPGGGVRAPQLRGPSAAA